MEVKLSGLSIIFSTAAYQYKVWLNFLVGPMKFRKKLETFKLHNNPNCSRESNIELLLQVPYGSIITFCFDLNIFRIPNLRQLPSSQICKTFKLTFHVKCHFPRRQIAFVHFTCSKNYIFSIRFACISLEINWRAYCIIFILWYVYTACINEKLLNI